MVDMLQVGVITSTHGLKGEVKVFPTTDDPRRFDALKEVYLETKEGKQLLHVQSVKYFKQYVILKFKEYSNINDIEKYRKCPLLVTRENAVELEENENFIADLIGLKVILESGEEFGVLTDVLLTGANDVYVVDSKEHGEVLLPAIKQCILDVNLEEGTITVHIMAGLLGE